MKILFWDRCGYVLVCKRLEHGQFRVFDQAHGGAGAFEVLSTDLSLLLEGIDLRGSRRRISHDDLFKKRTSLDT